MHVRDLLTLNLPSSGQERAGRAVPAPPADRRYSEPLAAKSDGFKKALQRAVQTDQNRPGARAASEKGAVHPTAPGVDGNQPSRAQGDRGHPAPGLTEATPGGLAASQEIAWLLGGFDPALVATGEAGAVGPVVPDTAGESQVAVEGAGAPPEAAQLLLMPHLAAPLHAASAPVATVTANSPALQMMGPAAQPVDSTALEAFVARAVAEVVSPQQVASQTAEPDAPTPTFGQLVDLLAQGQMMEARQSQTGNAMTGENSQATIPPAEAPAAEEGTAPPPFAVATTESGTGAAMAAEEPGPARTVDPEPVVRQVAQFARVLIRQDRSEARLQLHPEHLGQVQIKLVVAEGAVKATLLVTESSAKAALDAGLDQLKIRIAEQGLKVTELQVSVGTQNHPSGEQAGHRFHGGQSQTPQHGRQPFGDPAPVAESETRPLTAPLQPALRGIGARLNSWA